VAYTSVSNVRTENPDIAENVATDARVLRVIQRSDATIDSMLRGRYAVPFAATPPLIDSISTELTAVDILYAVAAGSGKETEQALSARREHVMGLLNDLKDGATKLLDESGDEIGTSSTGLTVTHSGYSHTHDHDNFEDHETDADLIADVGNAR